MRSQTAVRAKAVFELSAAMSDRVQPPDLAALPYDLDVWRLQAAWRSYLVDLGADDLRQRAECLLRILWDRDASGGFYWCTSDPWAERWWRKLVHLLEHAEGIGVPLRLDDLCEGLGIPTSAPPAPAMNESVLCKFGKGKHLAPLLELGRLRLSGAAFYRADHLSEAVRDPNELSRSQAIPGAWTTIRPMKGGPAVQPLGSVTKREEIATDYYCFAAADSYYYRNWEDYPDYDACLAIRDPDEFYRRLGAAIARTIPDTVHTSAVDYRDELYDPSDPLDRGELDGTVVFDKDYRYAFEREVRTVVIPGRRVELLDPLFVSLGPIDDIAVLIPGPT